MPNLFAPAPFPKKGAAHTVVFIATRTGVLNTDCVVTTSEVSFNAGSWNASINAPVEVNAPSGVFYLNLDLAEMNADSVLIRILYDNADPTLIALYPEDAGDIRVNVTQWLGAAAPAMTGDAYARLGVPAGASIAADIIATPASVWAVTTRTLSSFGSLVGDIATAVWGAGTRTLTAISDSAGITTLLTRIASALTITSGKVDVNDKTGFALTSGERTAIANEVEAQIIDETDSEKVLLAITNKIASVNPDLSGLTLGAIASAVWTSAQRRLTDGVNIILAKGVGLTGLNDLSAAQINAEVDAALADYDAPTKAELDSGLGALHNLSSAQAQTAAAAALAANTDLSSIKALADKMNTALELDGSVYRFTINALEQAPVSEGSTDWSSTERAQIRSRLGLDGTQTIPATNSGMLPRAAAKITSIGVGAVNVVSPVTPSGKIIIIAGDDYLAAHGRAIGFKLTGFPDLTGADAVFRLVHAGVTVLEKPAALLAEADAVFISSELEHSETIGLQVSKSPENYKFEFEVTLADGSKLTVRRGVGTVLKNYPAAE